MTDTNHWDAELYKESSYLQEEMTKLVLAGYHIDEQARVLDIGCGDGRMSSHIAGLVPNGWVTAIDRSVEMIRYAAPTHQQITNLEFFPLDAQSIEGHEEFDQIVSFFCLHWIEDQLAVLKRIYRALHPGGRVLLVLAPPTEEFIVHQLIEKVASSKKWSHHFADYSMPGFFRNVSEYRPFLEQAGFQIESIELESRTLTWPKMTSFMNFVGALPLFEKSLPRNDKRALVHEIAEEYKKHCDQHENGELRLRVNPLVVKATK